MTKASEETGLFTPESKRKAVNIISAVEERMRKQDLAGGELDPVYRPGYDPKNSRFADEPEFSVSKDFTPAQVLQLLEMLDHVVDLTDERPELVRAQELTRQLVDKYGYPDQRHSRK